jgi:DNA-directed RNA polymerase subunit beta'
MPREIRGTQDITGGLPRVVELFEARRPRDPAIVSEIDGIVELGERRRGKRVIKVSNPKTGIEREHLIPPGKHIRVQTGDYVKAGEPLVEGPLVLQDILAVSGTEAVQRYILQEIQSVYRSQGVKTDDKHIEIIVAQMMRFVKITDSGDSSFLQDEVVDKFVFRKEVNRLKEKKKNPPTAKEIILGITRAALISDSFISSASFQETIKVLTKAALEGKVDRLEGLKENVILGHIIPAGTGYRKYRRMRVKKEKFIEGAAVEEITGEAAAR